MITFKNGTTFETVSINGGTMQYQSATRSTLEIRCSTSVATFEELKSLYTDADALSELTISEIQSRQKTNEDGENLYIDITTREETTIAEGNEPAMVIENVVQSVHLNYTLPVELKLTTINDIEVYCMKFAQMSNLEIEQSKQNDVLTALLMGV